MSFKFYVQKKTKLAVAFAKKGLRFQSISIIFLILFFAAVIGVALVGSIVANFPSVISILVMVVVLVVIMSAIIAKPLVSIIIEMKKVSQMNLSVLEKGYRFSMISELRQIEEIFLGIVSTMKLFQSFVPSSLFEEDVDDEDDDVNPQNSSNGLSKHSPSVRSSNDGSSQMVSQYTLATKKAAEAMKITKRSFKRKTAVMIIDIEGFNSLTSVLAHQDLIYFHNKYLNAMSNVIQENSGEIETFIGDKCIVSWNGVKRCKDKICNLACKTALECMDSVANVNENFNTQGYPPLSIRIGIDYGYCVVGVFGTSKLKSKASVGPCISFSHFLQKQCKQLGSKILISEAVKNEIDPASETFRVRPIEILRPQAKRQARGLTVAENESKESDHGIFEAIYEVVATKSKLGESWMHGYEESEISRSGSEYLKAFDYYRGGKLEASKKLLLKIIDEMNYKDAVCLNLLKRVESLIQIKEDVPNIPVEKMIGVS